MARKPGNHCGDIALSALLFGPTTKWKKVGIPTRWIIRPLLLCCAALLLSSCGTQEFVVRESTAPKHFFSTLNEQGRNSAHEIFRVDGYVSTGSHIECDNDSCWWRGADSKRYSLAGDSILAIRFHSVGDAIERSYLSYLGFGALTGLGLVIVPTALLSGMFSDAPEGQDGLGAAVHKFAGYGMVTGSALGLIAILTDGQGATDVGLTSYIFRDDSLVIQRLIRTRPGELVMH